MVGRLHGQRAVVGAALPHLQRQRRLQPRIPAGRDRYNLPPQRVMRARDELVEVRGAPQWLRMDNGPELISAALKQWAQQRGVELVHIQPGKPTPNAYIERFNKTYRAEVLHCYVFTPNRYFRVARKSEDASKDISRRSVAVCMQAAHDRNLHGRHHCTLTDATVFTKARQGWCHRAGVTRKQTIPVAGDCLDEARTGVSGVVAAAPSHESADQQDAQAKHSQRTRFRDIVWRRRASAWAILRTDSALTRHDPAAASFATRRIVQNPLDMCVGKPTIRIGHERRGRQHVVECQRVFRRIGSVESVRGPLEIQAEITHAIRRRGIRADLDCACLRSAHVGGAVQSVATQIEPQAVETALAYEIRTQVRLQVEGTGIGTAVIVVFKGCLQPPWRTIGRAPGEDLAQIDGLGLERRKRRGRQPQACNCRRQNRTECCARFHDDVLLIV